VAGDLFGWWWREMLVANMGATAASKQLRNASKI
jgi:hypothetical protein